jgi:hypothetical protein
MTDWLPTSVDWAVLDATTQKLTCLRCGAVEDPPPLPMDLREYVGALREFARKHADCLEGGPMTDQPSTQDEQHVHTREQLDEAYAALEPCGERMRTTHVGVTLVLVCQRLKGHDGTHFAYTGDSFTTWGQR